MTPADLPANFAAKIRVDGSGCWVFIGAIQSSGYGCIALDGDGTHRLAHRAAYELLIAKIPDGLVIDHLCLRKSCVNPAHLEAVTVAENNRRAIGVNGTWRSRLTHCKRGHEFTDANTYHDHRGHRQCRCCKRMTDRAAYHRRLTLKDAS